MKLLIQTIVAIVAVGNVLIFTDITATGALALFFGLQGTMLLASAISPPETGIVNPPKGVVKRMRWYFGEGTQWRYPMNFNPACFYIGLMFIALSLIISSIPGRTH